MTDNVSLEIHLSSFEACSVKLMATNTITPGRSSVDDAGGFNPLDVKYTLSTLEWGLL